MNASSPATTNPATTASSSLFTTRAFWDGFWRTSGLQFLAILIVAYVVYGYQPPVGASADALVAFYQGERARLLIAAVLGGMALLYLMWFAAAIRTVLADAGQDGWGAAATASSAALGGLFLLLMTATSGLAYSITASGNHTLVSALNDLAWAGTVLSSFPRAMLIMAGSFGLWRAKLIPNTFFAAGVLAVVLNFMGGTTWLSGGFWAPDGVYARFALPLIDVVWVLAVSQVLLKRQPARTGW